MHEVTRLILHRELRSAVTRCSTQSECYLKLCTWAPPTHHVTLVINEGSWVRGPRKLLEVSVPLFPHLLWF